MIPTDASGKPLPPDAGTCPLTDQKVAKETAGPVDVSTIESTRRQLPKPEKRPAVEPESPVEDGQAVDQRRSNGDSDRRGNDASSNRPVKGRCFYCRTDLGEGEGRLDRQGNKTIVRCSPNCTERRRQRRGSVT
jgi:hypothetical protein